MTFDIKLLFIFSSFVCFVSSYDIWPHPKLMIQKDEFYSIDPKNFTINAVTKGKCEILQKAVKRYQSERIFIQDCSRLNRQFKGRFFSNTTKDFKKFKSYLGQLTDIFIIIEDECELLPHSNMNETYFIEIGNEKNEKSAIYSKTVWGAIRGLETLSQMIVRTGKDQFKIHLGLINDSPRFSFRGILIDTARHFLPLQAIYKTLDAMEMNKFNILHWHIVDDQSFPFVSETFPQLSKKGAYKDHYIYNFNDVKNVIEYAAERGIRVIPEFDTPGHTESWGKGQPNLLTECYINGKPSETYGPINPILNSTYGFIQKFFHEIFHRFPDKYIHLGGDEVSFHCWASNPSIQEFMKKEKFDEDYRKLENYYMKKLINIVQNLNRSYIVWQEVFDNGVTLKPETVVHIWKFRGFDWEMELNRVTSAGFHVILSSCWYLNYISYGSDWFKYYQCDPQNFNGTLEQQKLVIGGEACLWSEFIDASNLISRTWPRACAVAERLWSEYHLKDYKKVKSRFHLQRCRMQYLGLRVEPISGPDFCWCDDAL